MNQRSGPRRADEHQTVALLGCLMLSDIRPRCSNVHFREETNKQTNGTNQKPPKI